MRGRGILASGVVLEWSWGLPNSRFDEIIHLNKNLHIKVKAKSYLLMKVIGVSYQTP
jgi:hypothetical protein